MVCHDRFAGFGTKRIGCWPETPAIRYVGGAANVTGIGLMIFGPIEGNLNLIRQYPRLI